MFSQADDITMLVEGRLFSTDPRRGRDLDDLPLDATQAMALAAAVEDQFNIVLSDEELAGLHTIGDLIYAVQCRREVSGVFECPMLRL